MHFCINSPRVAHETIDGETMIIDFDSGTYYCVQGVANHIWTLVAEIGSVEQIVSLAQAQYIGEPQEIETAVRQFIASLTEEGLLVESEARPRLSALPTAGPGLPFTTPLLERHTDMQDLLLLDPIHDVDEQGWPLRKQ